MTKGCFLQDIVERVGNNISDFEDYFQQIKYFSNDKSLYDYQEEALKNFLRLMFLYYKDFQRTGENIDLFNSNFINYYINEHKDFKKENNIPKFKTKKNTKLNEQFVALTKNGYFKETTDGITQYIDCKDFYNRCAFWMATASGKSVVIIKLIDLLYKLMNDGLIPTKNILLLSPKDYILQQIINESKEFNLCPKNENKINFITLREFNNYIKTSSSSTNDVFIYRSDLIRDIDSENIINYVDIENNGDWYVILDEAHRGENDTSLSKNYFRILSRRGFLFNFSATFSDVIDFQTTLYNFNLERFINKKYGKNILVSDTLFTFKKNDTELDEEEKRKEVLKSFIIFTAIKKSRFSIDTYHSPLLVTLVNSINTKNSDLKMFFNIVELIASGNIKNKLFKQAKNELLEKEFFSSTKDYSIGNEALDIKSPLYDGKSFYEIIKSIDIKDILKELFNSDSFGKIELIHTNDEQEIALKLETASDIFGLIKIGERDKFENLIISKESNYSISKTILKDNYFSELEYNDNINLLCGSRVFYEGWDTNRPNVINLIDIGSKNAKKFVPQAIGRGVRIRPTKESRKRLENTNPYKNQLLETLFVFATSKDILDTIVKPEVASEVRETEYTLSLKKNDNIGFDLYIPVFEENNIKIKDLPKFGLSEKSYNALRRYFLSFDEKLFLITYNITKDDYHFIKNALTDDISNSNLFKLEEKEYLNIPNVIKKIISHINRGSKYVKSISVLQETDIKHFKKIKLYYDDAKEKDKLVSGIQKLQNMVNIDSEKNKLMDLFDKGHLTMNEFVDKIQSLGAIGNELKPYEQNDIVAIQLANHYYLPILYSKTEKNNHIGNIIKCKSEHVFIENLINKLHTIKTKWCFSKLVENVDEIYIPYFSKEENRWRNFYSDFIFWVKRDSHYDVYFVDPKGTKYSAYEEKVYYYKKFFYNEKTNSAIKFKCSNNETIQFHLKLVTDDTNNISEANAYKDFWILNNDFSFLQ